ncbi:MAG: DUF4422 domain-containing protein [Candidatus Weimeria sp.]
MDTRIYEITHKEFPKPDLPEYIRLQAGAALHEDLGYVPDNIGDNISEKNPNYCELTGIYWLWKNVSCDIIGICHYRRYFFYNGDFLRKEDIESILKDYDVILPRSYHIESASVYDFYKEYHHIEDLDTVREIISELYPDYLDSFDLCMRTGLINPLNMLVAGKTTFDRYCEWLFSILSEAEKKIDISGYDEYQSRIFGFLAERLTKVFFIHNSYRIKECEIIQSSPSEIENSLLVSDLKKKQVAAILSDINRAFLNGSFHDLVDSRPMDIDFHGKTPVWFCWWQGMESAPDIVKICLSSILDHLPSDKAELHFISIDNVGQYINLPDWVVKRFSEGKISLSHLSHILRAGLLYRYGGLWLDADCYMAGPFDEKFWDSEEFYSPRSEGIVRRYDIARGRWTSAVIKGAPLNDIFRYLLNGLYQYWQIMDQLTDDAVPGMIMSEACDTIPWIRKQTERCPVSQPHINTLRTMLNDPFDQKKWQDMIKDTNIFRLSYKEKYRTETLIGDKTFYSFLISPDDRIR